jgi:hypothetical protein
MLPPLWSVPLLLTVPVPETVLLVFNRTVPLPMMLPALSMSLPD